MRDWEQGLVQVAQALRLPFGGDCYCDLHDFNREQLLPRRRMSRGEARLNLLLGEGAKKGEG